MTKNIFKIYVDADACPVKEEIIQLSKKYDVEAVFIASYAHASNKYKTSKWVYVDSVKEEVDFYIINQVKKHDIVITQDLGLASIILKKGATVISPRGILFKEETMEYALHIRYSEAKQRRSGKYGKGPKPFLDKDRYQFSSTLEKILSESAGIF